MLDYRKYECYACGKRHNNFQLCPQREENARRGLVEASQLANTKPSQDIVVVGRLHEKLRDLNTPRDTETQDTLFSMARQVFLEDGYLLVPRPLQKRGEFEYYTVPPLPDIETTPFIITDWIQLQVTIAELKAEVHDLKLKMENLERVECTDDTSEPRL